MDGKQHIVEHQVEIQENSGPNPETTSADKNTNHSRSFLILKGSLQKSQQQKTGQNELARFIENAVYETAVDETEPDWQHSGSSIEDFIRQRDDLDLEIGVEDKLAHDLIEVEKTIITPLRKQILEAYPQPDQTQKDRASECVISVRESLYALLINRVISAPKLCALLTGINFQINPSSELSGLTLPAADVSAAYIGGQRDRRIFVYEKFLSEPAVSKKAIVMHEIAHLLVESSDIWQPPGIYAKYKEISRNPSAEQVSWMKEQNPALASILEIIIEPAKHLAPWNHYIRTRLIKLAAMQDGPDLADERQAVAMELAAEMTAPYLSNGQSEETYLAERIKFSRPEDIIAYLQQLSGTATEEQFADFCAQRGVDIAGFQDKNPNEILDSLAGIDEFSPFFGANYHWRAMLGQYLSNRCENVHPTDATSTIEDHTTDDGFAGAEAEELSSGYFGSRDPDHYEVATASKTKNLFEIIWDFLEGKNSNEPRESKQT